MILTDTGPLIALIDEGQGDVHTRCVDVFQNLKQTLLTTWPCFTKAMYFLERLQGWQAQQVLWRFVTKGLLTLHSLSETEQRRMQALMEKYQDLPMDLADASLVALAETRNDGLIFTLDGDFQVYRWLGQKTFTILPNS